MKLLLDQDVWAVTTRFLVGLGHDVVTAADIGQSQADDSDLLHLAKSEARILITRDRDFGELIFVKRLQVGVVYLRIEPQTRNSVHEELKRILETYAELELKAAFVVVEPGRHRFRKISS